MKRILMALLVLVLVQTTWAQGDLTAQEIVTKADEKLKGESSIAVIKMTIVRPSWSREMTMKSWSKGNELSLITLQAPARDKGTAFLKRGKEIWNWQPTIDRSIKMPPSMMMQSWMGSDFTNDDLVKQSSMVTDYTQKILDKETIEGRQAYKIELIPKEDAAVVWGKILIWIDTAEFIQLKTEFYDEEDYLVNTMLGKDIKMLGGKLLPARLEVIPEDKEGNKTIVEYLSLDFDQPMKDEFFSIQNMKRAR
ncbi:MAG: outer membrane lipoprotein-sorting protein [Saprospiraceae bacterium]|nr:MAG: outer membrane lipoprotein-sorting protein [Saprospiraceae bacterium]